MISNRENLIKVYKELGSYAAIGRAMGVTTQAVNLMYKKHDLLKECREWKQSCRRDAVKRNPCAFCGETFIPTKALHNYCSTECRELRVYLRHTLESEQEIVWSATKRRAIKAAKAILVERDNERAKKHLARLESLTEHEVKKHFSQYFTQSLDKTF